MCTLHVTQCLPVTFAGSRVEELDATECDSQCSCGVVSFVLEMQKELAELIFGDLLGRTFAIIGKFPHGPQVAVMRAFGHPGQMQIIAHALMKWSIEVGRMCHGVCLSEGKNEASEVDASTDKHCSSLWTTPDPISTLKPPRRGAAYLNNAMQTEHSLHRFLNS